MKHISTPRRAGLRKHCVSSQPIRTGEHMFTEGRGHQAQLGREDQDRWPWSTAVLHLSSQEEAGSVWDQSQCRPSRSVPVVGRSRAATCGAVSHRGLSLPCKNTDCLGSILTRKLMTGVGRGCGATEEGASEALQSRPWHTTGYWEWKAQPQHLTCVHLHVDVASIWPLSHCSLSPSKSKSKSVSLDSSCTLMGLQPPTPIWENEKYKQCHSWMSAVIPGNASGKSN